MPANKLIFKNAELARDALLVSQKEEIAALYQQWAAEIGERAKYYSHKSAPSYAVALERQIIEDSAFNLPTSSSLKIPF